MQHSIVAIFCRYCTVSHFCRKFVEKQNTYQSNLYGVDIVPTENWQSRKCDISALNSKFVVLRDLTIKFKKPGFFAYIHKIYHISSSTFSAGGETQ